MALERGKDSRTKHSGTATLVKLGFLGTFLKRKLAQEETFPIRNFKIQSVPKTNTFFFFLVMPQMENSTGDLMTLSGLLGTRRCLDFGMIASV